MIRARKRLDVTHRHHRNGTARLIPNDGTNRASHLLSGEKKTHSKVSRNCENTYKNLASRTTN